MEEITTAIVDDEPLARENLRYLLSIYPQISIVGEADSVQTARWILNTKKPKAVFLDIQMPGGTGFDVLSGLDQIPQVVFVTAYDEFAVRAFEVNALDYLLKPINRKRLDEAVGRLSSNFWQKGIAKKRTRDSRLTMEDEVLLHVGGRYFLFPVRRMAAISARRNYTEITTIRGKSIQVRKPFLAWLKRLPNPPFVQLDRSNMVNISAVREFTTSKRTLEILLNGSRSPLSLGRAALARFQEFMESNYQL